MQPSQIPDGRKISREKEGLIMADDGQDVVNSITDPIKGAWKSVNDLASKIPGILRGVGRKGIM